MSIDPENSIILCCHVRPNSNSQSYYRIVNVLWLQVMSTGLTGDSFQYLHYGSADGREVGGSFLTGPL